MSKESISKIYLILEKIEYIEAIVSNAGSITNALHDLTTYRPAILMHLTSIAEQFDKLRKSSNNTFLEYFEADDLKGIYDVRNYIAHDYEGVNLAIIEWIIRHILPKFKEQCSKIIEKSSKFYM
ncbi:HepT-like ribonuclease domain-containing protein [Sulfurospirillum multivorans]|uniref:DUF86 domain-containing protein n=2 Tax=Sulfurospirillum multivorans TaxID=66821 RepID=A0AA86DYK5_SULMK|nr:HepT-like ribonuclease domain-containing protein [Sulfurospirillum multivorans]AHJ13373.1 hypothetical protein SMUL_2119 [Sulfurospirillum multivorans DSM 12446]QEH06864.1 hypothetical protein SMN_2099 [Sulfurospirillum multivorans]